MPSVILLTTQTETRKKTMLDNINNESLEAQVAVTRLSKDLLDAAAVLTDQEARYLVDYYYMCQDDRIRFNGQIRAMNESEEPNLMLDWLAKQANTLESQIKRALDRYTDNHPVGVWMKSLHGVGPVLAAGFLAHIRIEQAPTAGHIWSYAGVLPDQQWVSSDASKKWVKEFGLDVEAAARQFNRNPDRLREQASVDRDGNPIKMTAASLAAAISKRPWNAELKKLLFKFGDVQIKFSNDEKSYYGKIFKERKAYEWEKNLAGEYAHLCNSDAKSYGDATESIGWVKGCFKAEDVFKYIDAGQSLAAVNVKKIKGAPGTGTPMLPPAHIQARARRYCGKMFLSHLHEVWYETHFKCRVPNPFVIQHGGHVHRIEVPNYNSPYAGQTPSAPFRIRRMSSDI